MLFLEYLIWSFLSCVGILLPMAIGDRTTAADRKIVELS